MTGKYDDAHAHSRLAGAPDDPARRPARDGGRALAALAADWGTSAAALAVAFALGHPSVASVLVGATSPVQLDQLLDGIALSERLDESQRLALRAVAR